MSHSTRVSPGVRFPQVSHLFQLLSSPDSSPDSVSTFELLSSGLVKTLIDFLQGADLVTVVDGSGKQEQLLARLLEFAEVSWSPLVTHQCRRCPVLSGCFKFPTHAPSSLSRGILPEHGPLPPSCPSQT